MAKQSSAQEAKPGFITRTVAYFQEVRGELDKVTWPSREDLKAHTLVVLFFLGLLSVMVGTMDVAFQRAVLTLFSLI